MVLACLRFLVEKLWKLVLFLELFRWTDALRLMVKMGRKRAETDVFLRRVNRRVTIRPGTSDFHCISKVFVHEEYAIPFEATNPRLIIDAGANIGLTTLYFSARFPDAKIIAIEPESSNYELLVRNCAGMTNVTPRHAAVWNTDTPLQIENPDAEKWGFKVTPGAHTGSAIKALTIPQILAQSGHDTIDILKLDIEGAERELFCNGCETWLPHVTMIIIELHDRYIPGCSHAVYSKLCQLPFQQEVRGENVFLLLGSDK
jgi:FkbM family methyltransferase